MPPADAALLELLERLKRLDYHFVSVTPATHRRIFSRPGTRRASLRDIFGWNLPFAKKDLGADLLGLLREAGAVEERGSELRCKVRVASLGDDLFLHSSFPTDQPDSVFFGPDTYRFANFFTEELRGAEPAKRIVDMGTGSGAGGIHCARLSPESSVTLVDINASALRLAQINAAAAGVAVQILHESRIPQGADLILANPPYMIDRAARTYRDGGDLLGGAVAIDWVRQALGCLSPGGQMLLYLGVAMVDGGSPALVAMGELCARARGRLRWRELDPDVFGEELENPLYANVERIAAVGCVIEPPDS